MTEYDSVINNRYKAPILSKIWCFDYKIKTMRQLWIDLATIQKELGINTITDIAIKELNEKRDIIDYEKINALESKYRHDIVAHINAYADMCPNGGKILHLGVTSNFINDNVDSVIIKKSFLHIEKKLEMLVEVLHSKAKKYSNIPTLAYTHLQPAQLITLGKRFSMWNQDIIMDLNKIKNIIIPFRGVKGTVGSEDTILKLFNGETKLCDALNYKLANLYGFKDSIKVCGQTYSRKYDVEYIHVLSCICQSVYKIMNDLRLLSSKKEIYENFTEHQVGSSAMPYKKNPITCEKICSLCRYVINQEQNATQTYINQWLERSLDDSAIKRIMFPECFLLVEHILNECESVITRMYFDIEHIEKQVQEHMINIVSEEIIINGVKMGFNRQEIHEKLRKILVDKNPSINKLQSDELISQIITSELLFNPLDYIGRSIEQSYYI